MFKFAVHTIESSIGDARQALEASKATYGGVPNIHGVMAGAPALLEAYQALNKLFMKTSLDNTERNIVWLVVNFENQCTYCMAAHSAIAKMSGMKPNELQALRSGDPLEDTKLETLRSFTAHMVQAKGWPAAEQLAAMESAGYNEQTVLEVILAIGMKTLSNYTNHVAATPLDKNFSEFEWQPEG